jgi:hypothetical protein
MRLEERIVLDAAIVGHFLDHNGLDYYMEKTALDHALPFTDLQKAALLESPKESLAAETPVSSATQVSTSDLRDPLLPPDPLAVLKFEQVTQNLFTADYKLNPDTLNYISAQFTTPSPGTISHVLEKNFKFCKDAETAQVTTNPNATLTNGINKLPPTLNAPNLHAFETHALAQTAIQEDFHMIEKPFAKEYETKQPLSALANSRSSSYSREDTESRQISFESQETVNTPGTDLVDINQAANSLASAFLNQMTQGSFGYNADGSISIS